jgi:hypothetical protein
MRDNGSGPGGREAGGRHRDERRGRLVPVRCARCGACVQVEKFSPQHTSVQWTADAVLSCVEFAAADRVSALVEGCGSLRDSIGAAAGAGP